MTLSTKARKHLEVTLASKARAKEFCDAIDAGAQVQPTSSAARMAYYQMAGYGSTSWRNPEASSILTTGTATWDGATSLFNSIRYVTGTVANDRGGLTGGANAFFAASRPKWTFKIRTDADITNMRIWAVLTQSAVSTLDVPVNNCMGFRFSTAAGDTTWKAVSNEDAQTALVVDTKVPVAINTTYLMTMDYSDPSKLDFYINDILVATINDATRLPLPSRVLLTQLFVQTLNTSAKTLIIGSNIAFELSP